MKHCLPFLALAAASGCVQVGIPDDAIHPNTYGIAIATTKHEATDRLPAHTQLAAPAGSHDPEVVRMALIEMAQHTCGEDLVEYLDANAFFEDPMPAIARLRFACKEARLPGRTDLSGALPLPEQPALAPGQLRRTSWSAGTGVDGRHAFESLLGGQIRRIYVEDCAGRGVTLDRIATYVRPRANDLLRRTDLVVDYTCVPNGDAPAQAGADA